MPVTATCPQCQATYKLPEAVFGKSVRCKKCSKVFVAGKAPASKAASAAPAKAPAKPVAKKTMMAEEDTLPGVKAQPEARAATRPPRSGIAKPAAPAAVARRSAVKEDDEIVEATPVRKPPMPADDDDIVEAVAAAPPRRPIVEDDEAIVEAVAAAPRPAGPLGKTPPPPAKGPRRLDDEVGPGGRRRRPEEDERDRPRRGRDADDLDDRRRPHGRDDDGHPDDDFDDPEAAPKKSRKGLFIGLAVGGVVLLGGVLLIFLLMGKGDGSDPRVQEHYTGLERDDTRHEAIAFFAAYAEPEKQDKMRSKVAQRLETILKNRMGGAWVESDLLVVAYCNWATPEQIASMSEALDWAGHNRISHRSNREMLINTLAKFKEPAAAEALAKEVRRSPFERQLAINALATMGDIGKKELVAFRFDNDHGLRMATRAGLEKAGAKDVDFLDAALRSLDDADPNRRHIAVEFFRDFRDPPSDKAKVVAEKLLAMSDGRHPRHHGDAVNALIRWINKDTAALVATQIQKADKNTNCEQLLKTLLPYKDVPEVPDAFIKRLDTNHHFERQFALKSLEDMGGPAASKAFLAMLNSHDGGLRNRARLMLTSLSVSLEKQIEQSIADLTSTHGETRRSAAEFLAKAPPNDKQRDAVGKALTPMFVDEHWGVRDQVFLAMANWPSKEVYTTLYKLVNDAGTADLRRRSMDAMSKIGDPGLAPYIAARLKVVEDRHHAAQALRNMGSKSETALHKYLSDTDANVRREALGIIRQFGTNASLAALKEAAGAAFMRGDKGFYNELDQTYKELVKK